MSYEIIYNDVSDYSSNDEFFNYPNKPIYRKNPEYMLTYQYPTIIFYDLIKKTGENGIWTDDGCIHYEHKITKKWYVWHDSFGSYWTCAKNEHDHWNHKHDYFDQFPHKRKFKQKQEYLNKKKND
jgi:hypothetical protein